MPVGKNSIRRMTTAASGDAAKSTETEPKATVDTPSTERRTEKKNAAPKKAAKTAAAPTAAIRLGQPLPYWLL